MKDARNRALANFKLRFHSQLLMVADRAVCGVCALLPELDLERHLALVDLLRAFLDSLTPKTEVVVATLVRYLESYRPTLC